MASIGYSYWGFCEDHPLEFDTPDGQRFCRPLLVRELQRRGHKVYALQRQREAHPIMPKWDGEKLDVVFMEWRWLTYKGITEDLIRQEEILDSFKNIIIRDADLEIKSWLPHKIIWNGIKDIKKLGMDFISMPFFMNYDDIVEHEKSIDWIYVGNEYGRDNLFIKYYKDKPAHIIGKWSYKIVGHIHHGRLNHPESMEWLSKARNAYHLPKESYLKDGQTIPPSLMEKLFYGVRTWLPEECSELFPGKYIDTEIFRDLYPLTELSNWVDKFEELI